MTQSPLSSSQKKNARVVNMCFDDEKVCFSPEHYSICDKGMCLRTNWFFDFGTELSINLEVKEPADKTRKIKCSGVIISCEKVPDSKTAYDCTLYFTKCLDVSNKVLQSASRLIHVAS
ncbi:hypothetical protein QQ054_11170 [Oscillatoria amoena NRMC-F 0135]|nr:hypothetical protein [Oscillatoria laete-virens]MDL5046593.1 hypothetical protein [Oscillatoria amoena NRMC-F 0135]MDL5053583.1 hypothetical protein [Oscillatoria laete-virens NRMC-F 0139]